ncbi:PGRS repeat-containing protein [Mycolicibacter icosiumassiliensis]|uniref:PGRS repeat-containing protein n=1 Tax=Mycolicibacter icosiumassiliensis TaxID=1792835 RepID=UPI000836EDBE|nr:hypothetical protein [Mycolicibacter icosiumassiliensis]
MARAHDNYRGIRLVGVGSAVALLMAVAPVAHADFDIDDLFDPALWVTAPAADATTADFSDSAAAGSGVDPLAWYIDAGGLIGLIYAPLHDFGEDWIASSFGAQLDNLINPLFAIGDHCGLICNGEVGTAADPTGGGGGWFFGDGGAGWGSDQAGVAGGEGGAAGLFGNGGRRQRRQRRQQQ